MSVFASLLLTYYAQAIHAERGLKSSFEASKADTGPEYAKSPVTGYRPSVEALRGLGWNASVSLAEGFRRTVDSMEQERAESGR